tara:strand:- start:518 stop:919 length:402 start_codon:yes stop_codon:yes gene_type:complete
MASELRVTTIANNAGTESINTTYVVNGSKGFCNFNHGTATLVDSLNTSSLTDTSAGKGAINWTSAMSGANYTCVTGTGTVSGSTAYAVSLNDNDAFVTRTSSAWSFLSGYAGASSAALFDSNESICAAYGDLA